MARRLLLSLMLLAATVSPAQSKLPTAQELLWQCEGKLGNEPNRLMGMVYCVAYISGIIDAGTVLGTRVPRARLFCIPRQGIANDQARRVFIKWANDNPQKLHWRARTAVIVALANAFPCK